MATTLTTRQERGAKISAQGIERINETSFWVKSQSGKGGYSVTMFQGKWTCDCPDNRFRGVTCKHVYAVESALSGAGKSWRFSLGLWEAPI
ncbi:MAG: SWIM zinc finger family protein [Candidatus Bathyarchaeia archaeon]